MLIKSSALAPATGDVGIGEGSGTGVAVGVGEGFGTGVAVGIGVGMGMLDAATAPETGVGVTMLEVVMLPETRLWIGVAVEVGDGNVLRTAELLVCWGLSWLNEQATEPAIKTSRMEISVHFLKGVFAFSSGSVLEV